MKIRVIIIIAFLIKNPIFSKDFSFLKKIEELRFQTIKLNDEKMEIAKQKKKIEKELKKIEEKYKNLEKNLENAKIDVQNILKDLYEMKKQKITSFFGGSTSYLDWVRLQGTLTEVLKSKVSSFQRILDDYNSAKIAHFFLIIASANIYVLNKTLIETEKKIEEMVREMNEIVEKCKKDPHFYKKLLSETQMAKEELDVVLKKINRNYFQSKGFSTKKGKLLLPIREGKIKIPYGEKVHPVFKTKTFHNGLSIEPPNWMGGVKNVRAIYFGRVVFAARFSGFGNLVILDHAEGYYSLYGNLDTINVSAGNIVEEGDVVGKIRAIEGEKEEKLLYFELRYNEKPIDPTMWFVNELKN